jgi:hypothetical protein
VPASDLFGGSISVYFRLYTYMNSTVQYMAIRKLYSVLKNVKHMLSKRLQFLSACSSFANYKTNFYMLRLRKFFCAFQNGFKNYCEKCTSPDTKTSCINVNANSTVPGYVKINFVLTYHTRNNQFSHGLEHRCETNQHKVINCLMLTREHKEMDMYVQK